MHLRNTTLAFVALSFVVACHKAPAPLAATPVLANNDSLDRAHADSIARANAARQAEIARAQLEQDSLRAVREREQREAAQNSDAMKVLAATIYYDFDSADLTEAARSLLLAKVPVMQARPAVHIRVTGHTDDRGSSEYNLALGLRRAAEAKAFLVNNGIDASRISITSMGAEMPSVPGENEEAWSRNRRSEFGPTVGATTP
ncbi:MAG TPA: OmpA family protein [Candidatus Baltobacteraceae bacterium]|nr:OmpA family protein [Candidatus Baltobacteraceae bacterium]